MTGIVSQLGFYETGELSAARTTVLRAIESGTLQEFRQAWGKYQSLAEAQIEALPDTEGTHAKAQIGLILAKSVIWHEAGDRVRYLEELADAGDYASGMQFTDLAEAIGRELSTAEPSGGLALGEYLQATRQIEPAIEAYIAYEQRLALTNRDRGMVNLRLAECYQMLLEQDEDEEVRELFEGSLQSALIYLEGAPEQAWALRLLDGTH